MIAKLTINKATYDISAFKATFKDTSITYDGTEHTEGKYADAAKSL